MGQYSKSVRGTFTSDGTPKFIQLPTVPDTFEIWNKTQWNSAVDNTGFNAIGFAEDAPGTANCLIKTGAEAVGAIKITSKGFSFIRVGSPTYGSVFTISGIVAATGVVTTTAPHGYSVGDTVLLYGTTGMLQIAGTATTITAVGSTTTFTIGNIPTAGFAAAATAGFVKQLFYPDIYLPFGNIITAVTPGATSTTISTSVNHSFVVGQEVFFTIPTTGFSSVWGVSGLDTLGVVTSTGVPQRATITSITDANTFVVNVGCTGTFAYPTSAQAALGITFPQVLAIGDQNSGGNLTTPLYPQPTENTYLNTLYTQAITIPGAFNSNTGQGVLIGLGTADAILHATSDVIAWEANFPDAVQLNV